MVHQAGLQRYLYFGRSWAPLWGEQMCAWLLESFVTHQSSPGSVRAEQTTRAPAQQWCEPQQLVM